ncbi:MAG: 50S ribosomal protein L15 [Bacilli bacterium]|nr:50S ribosomal protein L15 [Bacilli bacterium]
MKLHELERNREAKSVRRRVGRGMGSGLGKTSGRGEKGQKARSGVSIPAQFEGGQLPLYRRLPKRGFSNSDFKIRYATINVSDLNRFKDGDIVTPELLKETGILKNQLDGVKVLGDGECDKKLTVKAHKFSKSAIEKLENNGSKIEVI